MPTEEEASHEIGAPPEEMINKRYNPNERPNEQNPGGPVPTGTSGMRKPRDGDAPYEGRPMIEWPGGGT